MLLLELDLLEPGPDGGWVGRASLDGRSDLCSHSGGKGMARFLVPLSLSDVFFIFVSGGIDA